MFAPTFLAAEEPARWVSAGSLQPLQTPRETTPHSIHPQPLPTANSLRWKAPAVATKSATNSSVQPASAVANVAEEATVRPATLTLNAPENATVKSAAAGFRPKSPVVETATRPERTPAASSKHGSGWNKLRNDQTIQPASHEADPFDDPFGDQRSFVRQAQAQGNLRSVIQNSNDGTAVPEEADIPPQPAPRLRTRSQLEPPADYPNEAPMPPPRATIPPREASPFEPQTAPPMMESVEPLPAEPMTNQPQQPMRRPSYLPSEEPVEPEPLADRCQRIYNDRNCCGTDKHCRMANDLLRKMPLHKISLDITPRFKLDAPNWEEHDASRDEVLKRSESRRWFDREGNLRAEGRLTDLSHGHAMITTSIGTVARLPLGQLGEDELCFINAWWLLPPECIAESDPFTGRNWAPSTFTFTASALCHKPLYFEQVQAERYGHVLGPFLQPALSGAHFFLSIVALPYKMGINPPHECQYALGYYRPGSCAPWMIPPVPLSVRGAAMQTGVVVGGVFLIP